LVGTPLFGEGSCLRRVRSKALALHHIPSSCRPERSGVKHSSKNIKETVSCIEETVSYIKIIPCQV
jgi:hypothetical protein